MHGWCIKLSAPDYWFKLRSFDWNKSARENRGMDSTKIPLLKQLENLLQIPSIFYNTGMHHIKRYTSVSVAPSQGYRLNSAGAIFKWCTDPARTESLSVLPKFKGDRKFEASRRLIEMEGGKRVLVLCRCANTCVRIRFHAHVSALRKCVQTVANIEFHKMPQKLTQE